MIVPQGFRALRRADEFWEKFAQGIWEPVTVRVIDTLLAPGSTHIDVGAWVGPTVLLAATKAKRVLAFEPDPVAYAELEKDVALNPDLARRVELRQEALFDREGEMRMVDGGPSTSGALVMPLLTPEGCTGVLSAEMKGGSERDESSQALATIFAAQLATLVTPPVAAVQAKATAHA